MGRFKTIIVAIFACAFAVLSGAQGYALAETFGFWGIFPSVVSGGLVGIAAVSIFNEVFR